MTISFKTEDGKEIIEQKYMKFQRNKLVQGTETKFYIGSETIKQNQFDNVRHLISRISESGSTRNYKLTELIK